VILHLATTSSMIPVVEDINDKAEHWIAFYALALFADFSFPQDSFGRAKALSLLGYGLVIEIIQYFLPYRSFSLLDLSADAVGLVVYGISLPMLRRMPLLKKRWE
jgi:VanZ family protein